MKSISLKTKIITGLITGGMLLSSVSLALATTTKPVTTSIKAPLANEFKKQKGGLEATLKLGVSSNIITQKESDKITAYEKSIIKTRDKKEDKKVEKHDFFKELVTNNILTQAKADALKSNEQIQRKAQRQKQLQTNLAKLVTDTTITQDQSNLIKAAIDKQEAVKKAEFAKIKAMTDAERKAYMEANKDKHINPLKALVDNGTITQAQADKIGVGGPGKFNGGSPFAKESRHQDIGTNLAKLVTDKTITQDQSDKIKAAMIKEETVKKADFEKIKAMTDAERKAYMDANKVNHINPLKALVDSGIITQTQADKVGNVGFGGHGGNGAPGGDRQK